MCVFVLQCVKFSIFNTWTIEWYFISLSLSLSVGLATGWIIHPCIFISNFVYICTSRHTFIHTQREGERKAHLAHILHFVSNGFPVYSILIGLFKFINNLILQQYCGILRFNQIEWCAWVWVSHFFLLCYREILKGVKINTHVRANTHTNSKMKNI